MSENKNPWEGIEYSIRAYDHIKGEYRDFKPEKLPPEVFNRWLMWMLTQIQLTQVGTETRIKAVEENIEHVFLVLNLKRAES